MFTCPAEGTVSVVAAVPAGLVMDPPAGTGETEPVLVHMTCCPKHAREVRRYLLARTPIKDEVWSMGTDFLMRHWGQVIDPIELPVYALQQLQQVG